MSHLTHRARMLALTAAAALYSTTAWATMMPMLQQQGEIPYVMGGVGKEESAALQAIQRDYNLRITSADTAGHFFGNTRIVVSDMHQRVLLDLTGGPLFYINLPKGRYVVEGFSEMQVKKQTVTIANGQSARVHFSWKQTASDDFTDTPTRYY